MIPRLIPILLKNIVYSSDEISEILAENAEDVLDQNPPVFYRSKHSKQEGMNDDKEEDDYLEDEDGGSDWNLRKCSAASLDALSSLYGSEHILPFLLPALEEGLSHTDPWVREASILSLGAIAEGCNDEMRKHLDKLYPFLVSQVTEDLPQLRAISCWTLSRYADYAVFAADNGEGVKQLCQCLLSVVLDSNHKVQLAACSALSVLIESSSSIEPNPILPLLQVIYQNFVQALHTYKNHRSLIALFDSISICADFVGSPTGHQNLCCMYLPPLVQMWTSANPLDRRLLSLMESISCIALAIGLEIQPYALTIFDQCMLCIEACTIQVHTEDNATEEDCDFIVCATDIVDAMVEGMGGASFSTLLSSSRYADHFLNIVLGLCRSQVPGVRMSSFALIGDLTRNCANILQPAISEFVRESIRCIDVMHGSVCNNSLWALGEICVKCQDNHGVIDPFAADILRALVPILMGNGAQGNISSIPGLAENAASCLGRLSMVRAAYVSQELSTILPGW